MALVLNVNLVYKVIIIEKIKILIVIVLMAIMKVEV